MVAVQMWPDRQQMVSATSTRQAFWTSAWRYACTGSRPSPLACPVAPSCAGACRGALRCMVQTTNGWAEVRRDPQRWKAAAGGEQRRGRDDGQRNGSRDGRGLVVQYRRLLRLRLYLLLTACSARACVCDQWPSVTSEVQAARGRLSGRPGQDGRPDVTTRGMGGNRVEHTCEKALDRSMSRPRQTGWSPE